VPPKTKSEDPRNDRRGKFMDFAVSYLL